LPLCYNCLTEIKHSLGKGGGIININGLIDAEYGFSDFGDKIGDIYNEVSSNEAIVDIWDSLFFWIEDVPSFVITSILLALSLLEVFFGRKLLGLQKVVGSFILGFTLGIAYLSTHIPDAIPIPEWLIGLVIGVVAALVCKLTYFVLYVMFFGYGTYMIFKGGHLLPDSIASFVKDNVMIGLVVAAGVLILVLLFKRVVEKVGTAYIGGYLSSLCVATLILSIFDPGSVAMSVIKVSLALVLAVLGSIVQLRSRTRRW